MLKGRNLSNAAPSAPLHLAAACDLVGLTITHPNLECMYSLIECPSLGHVLIVLTISFSSFTQCAMETLLNIQISLKRAIRLHPWYVYYEPIIVRI